MDNLLDLLYSSKEGERWVLDVQFPWELRGIGNGFPSNGDLMLVLSCFEMLSRTEFSRFCVAE